MEEEPKNITSADEGGRRQTKAKNQKRWEYRSTFYQESEEHVSCTF